MNLTVRAPLMTPHKIQLFFIVIGLDIKKRVQCEELLVRSYVQLASKEC